MKQLTGFVPQYEIALQTLTVAEHLTFVVGPVWLDCLCAIVTRA